MKKFPSKPTGVTQACSSTTGKAFGEKLLSRVKAANERLTLLPCPFCGVVPEPVWIGADRCVFCQEQDCPTNVRGTLEEVIAAWNTRVEVKGKAGQ